MADKFATTSPDVTANAGVVDGTKGCRNQAALEKAFPNSPMYGDGGWTPATVKACADAAFHGGPVANALGGVVLPDGGTEGIINDGGYMFDSTQTLDYVGDNDVASNNADMDGTEFNAGGGAPATPYIPDTTAGVGGLDLTTDIPLVHNSYGSGDGGTANPLDTSANIALQTIDGVMGDLGDGSSGAGGS